jgi:CheY-like chemotaxis protein
LIVDYEAYNNQYLRIAITQLMGSDKTVDFAFNGEQAIDKVSKNLESNKGANCEYKLILTELQLPTIDGFETQHQIRQYLFERDIQ